MARIGHASPRAALIYQHATEERDRPVADFLESQIASADRTPLGAVQSIATWSGIRARDPRRIATKASGRRRAGKAL